MSMSNKRKNEDNKARENYAYWYIQDIIDREIKKAFQIKE